MVSPIRAVRQILHLSPMILIFHSSTPLSMLGNFVFYWANRFHLIPASHGDLESGTYSQVPGSARAEAERRR